jgi:hypothetical protein
VSDQQPRLDRDALIDGLNDLIERVRAAGIHPVRISIVGGAALALSTSTGDAPSMSTRVWTLTTRSCA